MELAALMQALLIILFVGGLSLLAHWGRKNHAAEIVLIVVLLFVSFVVMALGALVTLAGWSSVIPALDLPPGFSASSGVIIALAGLAGLALCGPPLRKVIVQRRTPVPYYDAVNPGCEVFMAADRSSDGWWSDPPIFFALWMFVFVLAKQHGRSPGLHPDAGRGRFHPRFDG